LGLATRSFVDGLAVVNSVDDAVSVDGLDVAGFVDGLNAMVFCTGFSPWLDLMLSDDCNPYFREKNLPHLILNGMLVLRFTNWHSAASK
jgi:hypothetical protein